MADDRVVDVDESKIVNTFLLNTCLLQPSMQYVVGIVMCQRLAPPPRDSQLIAGSVAEFYIQPMLSYVGDIDIMYHRCDEIAIPDGYPPPSHLPAEFHSRVTVCEIIDSEYPGYVYLMESYLLTENANADKYDAVQYDRRQYVSIEYPPDTMFEIHGPAQTIHGTSDTLAIDDVYCMRCLTWPTQAAD